MDPSKFPPGYDPDHPRNVKQQRDQLLKVLHEVFAENKHIEEEFVEMVKGIEYLRKQFGSIKQRVLDKINMNALLEDLRIREEKEKRDG